MSETEEFGVCWQAYTPKFSEITYREFPFHFIFITDLSVEWFALREFNDLRVFRNFQKISEPFVPIFGIFGIFGLIVSEPSFPLVQNLFCFGISNVLITLQ